ncbi:hypothetical protein D3C78_1436180 [compost metagenome]
MNANGMVNVRSLHQLLFPQRPVVHFDPHVGAASVRTFYTARFAQEELVVAMIAVESGQRHLASFNFPFMSAWRVRIKQEVLFQHRLVLYR